MFDLIKTHLTSVVFPPHCLHCQTPLPCKQMPQWCESCVDAMVGDESSVCLRCGAHLMRASPFQIGCAICRTTKIRFQSAVSIGNYHGALQQIVREMKRSKSEAVATQLGELLANLMVTAGVGSDANVIVPMPVHWWKKFRRGFNASSVIARGLSRSLQIPTVGNSLCCTRLTRKQGTLSTIARIKNVKGSVGVSNLKRVSGRHVILVDDVATSCATANEAAKELRAAGSTKVTLVVAARGVRSK